MRVVYMANVGTRDLIKDGRWSSIDIDGRREPNCRADGQQWLQDFDAVCGQLDAPILLPGLHHVLQLTAVVDVLLFYSNQDETAAERYRRSDTVHFAQVLQRLLPRRLPGKIGEVKLAQLLGSPADYNHTLPFFAERLPQLVAPDSVDAVYVAPVGGADASNVGLTINAVHCYREMCQFIYVTPDGGVHRLNLHRELLGNYARQEADAQLRRHDYVALRDTLRRARLGESWHQHLCDYADRRTRFDFQRAYKALNAAVAASDSGETIVRLQRLRQSLQPFVTPPSPPTSASDAAVWESWFQNQRALLSELLFNLRLKAGQCEWVDFLGRLFRLREALLRLVFELACRHSTEKHGHQFTDFAKGVQADPKLQRFMDEKGADYTDVNHRTLSLALEYWVTLGGQGQEYGPLHSLGKKIGWDELTQLRNKSIAAHGYAGVSEEDVVRAGKMQVHDLLDKLRDALTCVGAANVTAEDPYAAVQSMLREVISLQH